MVDIQKLQNEIGEWSDKRWKDSLSIEGMIRHLKEEVEHLFKNPRDPEHFADVQILFMNIARKAGFTMNDIYLATEAKHNINIAKEWLEPDKEGITRHA